MRTILFKAKLVGNGDWVEGTPVYYKSGEVCIYHLMDKYGNEATTLNRTNVIPETVCQYTGLKDKNGKRIFEEDICKTPDNDNIIIIYSNETPQEWERVNGGFTFYGYPGNELEITSNIYDQ